MRVSIPALMVLTALLIGSCGGDGGTTSSSECETLCQERCGDFEGCDCGGCVEGLTCNADNRCQTEDGCVPTCLGQMCGDNGCGGSCGDCGQGLVCQLGQCVEGCIPECADRGCGDDGCDGSCGECDEGESCQDGICLSDCEPDCEGRECGDDGCDGSCGECPGNGECVQGVCECTPDCEGRECGEDVCGGSCGECDEGWICLDGGTCECQPQCTDKECGDDGCGDHCGVCEASDVCEDGTCVCIPDCGEKVCGDDGCGGSCGECPVYHTCTADGSCICIPDCGEKACGSDGCGGLCGMCECGEECQSYQCVFTACEGRECGADGCGGSCGACDNGVACVEGLCPPPGAECMDDNDDDWDGCTADEITEFLVNDGTNGNQEAPDVVALPTGDYVVAYQDSAGDGNAYGVRLRWFPADGSLAPSSVLANTFINADQKAPAMARLEDNGFVVVWQSSGQDGSAYGVYGQRYDSEGIAAGEEFQCNSHTEFTQENPAVTVVAGGGFKVLWESAGQDGSSYGIYGKDFDTDSQATTPEYRVNSYIIAEQQMPFVTTLGSGGTLATWASKNQDTDGWGVIAQMFDAASQPLGLEFQVNTTTYSYQSDPVAVSLGNGDFVVLWQSYLQDIEGWGIVGQKFGAMGHSGTEFQVNQLEAGDQRSADIAPRTGGGFVVVWESERAGTEFDIMARLYDADGTPEGGEMVVNEYLAGDQTAPSVAVFPDDTYVVVWASENQDGSNRGVYARRLDPEGNLIYR